MKARLLGLYYSISLNINRYLAITSWRKLKFHLKTSKIIALKWADLLKSQDVDEETRNKIDELLNNAFNQLDTFLGQE